jgi:hypothetical protein
MFSTLSSMFAYFIEWGHPCRSNMQLITLDLGRVWVLIRSQCLWKWRRASFRQRWLSETLERCLTWLLLKEIKKTANKSIRGWYSSFSLIRLLKEDQEPEEDMYLKKLMHINQVERLPVNEWLLEIGNRGKREITGERKWAKVRLLSKSYYWVSW